MEETQIDQSKIIKKKEENPKNNKVLFWILGGCLALLITGAILAAVIFFWGVRKVKNEIGENQSKLDKWQAEAENQKKKTEDTSGKPALEDVPVALPPSNIPSENPSQAFPENSEKQMGYIKKVYEKSGKRYLDIDYIQWLMGSAAEKAMREDGECSKAGECVVLNDYYIRNVNPLVRSFEISPDAIFLMQTYDMETTGNVGQNKPISFIQFKNIFLSNAKSNLKNVPYIIEIENEQIIKITEQYVP